MLRPLLLRQNSKVCLVQQRSFAIMNRAKKLAGICDIIRPKPSPETVKLSTPSNTKVVQFGDRSLKHNRSPSSRPRRKIDHDLPHEQPRSLEYRKHDKPNHSRYQHPLKPLMTQDTSTDKYDSWTPKVVEKQSEHRSSPTKISLHERLARIQDQKAAGMHERLIRPVKEFTQPDNPHLIKVAVIGAPNAGKSTLVNKLVGEEVSIVSSKSHTTRERILAILSQDNYQVIFLDTPGIISPKSKENMNRSITTSSWRSLDEADHVLIMMDSKYITTKESQMIQDFMMERLSTLDIPATLIFNKMDVIGTDEMASLQKIGKQFKSIYPHIRNELYISALEEDGIDDVKKILFNSAKAQPWLYPPEQTLEISDLKRVEELIRVQFFKRLHRYIPYMLKQENMGWTELPNGTLRIEQNVYVERDSQHKIVVGANGMVINRVVEEAREDISKAFKRPIQLFIQVKTRKI
ncbi:P-loop containing nucleoside triphosphate hydrolase protein [Chlamydoabsidia padenii]|nr:P-loop containing nucleoside triphosphate hydrolase protein [Chlamydoabsidia padenii]